MKNKKTLYVLVPLLLIVWGLVFYRFFSSLHKENKKIDSTATISPIKEMTTVVADTFSILANYHDPFLSGKWDGEENSVKTIIASPPAPIIVQQKPVIIWPALNYCGIVANKRIGRKMAIMQIAGYERFMEEGDVINGVLIINIGKDSVLTQYQQEVRWVKKK